MFVAAGERFNANVENWILRTWWMSGRRQSWPSYIRPYFVQNWMLFVVMLTTQVC
jgi:hypothetical protein